MITWTTLISLTFRYLLHVQVCNNKMLVTFSPSGKLRNSGPGAGGAYWSSGPAQAQRVSIGHAMPYQSP